jgi:hypothetical protein
LPGFVHPSLHRLSLAQLFLDGRGPLRPTAFPVRVHDPRFTSGGKFLLALPNTVLRSFSTLA